MSEIDDQPSSKPEYQEPNETLHHVVAHKGLLHVMQNTGHSTIQEPDKHVKVLEDAKEGKAKTIGGRVGRHLNEGSHDKAADALNGHPLTGLAGKSHLHKAMQTMHSPMMSQEPHPAAFRSSVDYLVSSQKGKDLLDKSLKSLVLDKTSFEPRITDHKGLKEHIDYLSANPEAMLKTGGDLGHYLPEHGQQLAALSATAVNYLSSLKPTNTQNSPLDKVVPPSKSATTAYNRQLGIAENPLIVLEHAKKGTLLPQDIATLQTLYPKLHDSIVAGIGQEMIDVSSKNETIPYKIRSSLSMLLGQPLDSTMTSQSMQAIMASAVPKSGSQQPNKGKSGETATSQKAINQSNKMTQTPLQTRQINRK